MRNKPYKNYRPIIAGRGRLFSETNFVIIDSWHAAPYMARKSRKQGPIQFRQTYKSYSLGIGRPKHHGPGHVDQTSSESNAEAKFEQDHNNSKGDTCNLLILRNQNLWVTSSNQS